MSLNVKYCLELRQQPSATRTCGFGVKDRRFVDPTPILQLTIESPGASEGEIDNFLRNGHYVVSCFIYDENGSKDLTIMTEHGSRARRLLGTEVSTPFFGKDERDQSGCFFCFPYLSCRTEGSFRLKFSLNGINPDHANEIRHFRDLATVFSDIFTAYTPNKFPGMRPSSELVKRLKEQGCDIPIRKSSARQTTELGLRDHQRNDEDGEIGSSCHKE